MQSGNAEQWDTQKINTSFKNTSEPLIEIKALCVLLGISFTYQSISALLTVPLDLSKGQMPVRSLKPVRRP